MDTTTKMHKLFIKKDVHNLLYRIMKKDPDIVHARHLQRPLRPYVSLLSDDDLKKVCANIYNIQSCSDYLFRRK